VGAENDIRTGGCQNLIHATRPAMFMDQSPSRETHRVELKEWGSEPSPCQVDASFGTHTSHIRCWDFRPYPEQLLIGNIELKDPRMQGRVRILKEALMRCSRGGPSWWWAARGCTG